MCGDVDIATWYGIMIGIVRAMPDKEKQALLRWEREHVDGSGKLLTRDWPGFAKYNLGICPFIAAKPKSGYVYLIKAESGEYKIGYSVNVQKRLEALSSYPVDCKLVHSFFAENMNEAEKKLHKRFASCRIKHEWFALSSQDVEDIKSIIEYKRGEYICFEY